MNATTGFPWRAGALGMSFMMVEVELSIKEYVGEHPSVGA